MSRIHASALIITLLFAVGCSHTPDTVLVVDSAHSQIGQPAGTDGKKYTVVPVRRLTIDTRSFDFSKSLFPNVSPNAIQLVIDRERQYTAPWDPSGLTELSASTLQPMRDGPPFTGLVSGDQAVLAIGEEHLNQAEKKIDLKVLWVGLVEVSEYKLVPSNKGMKLSTPGDRGRSWPPQIGVIESGFAAYAQCCADG
jgi:hypothetical protein